MADDEMAPADRLYSGLEALKGWDDFLRDARSPWRQHQGPIGYIVSTVLLAGGEDSEPLAVSGHLDDAGHGELVVVYDRYLVVVEVAGLSDDAKPVMAEVYRFAEITSVKVAARHNYFQGTDRQARHDPMEVRIGIGGREVTIAPTPWGRHPLVTSDAIHRAFQAIRSRGEVSR